MHRFSRFVSRARSLVFPLLLSGAIVSAADVTCSLDGATAHQLTVAKGEDGSWEIKTTGSDPYVFLSPLEKDAMSDGRTILELGYFSVEGTDHFQVFLSPPCTQKSSVIGAGLAPVQGWGRHSVDLAPVFDAKAPPKSLRLDFGSVPDRLIRLKEIKLQALNPDEAARREKAKAAAEKEETLTRQVRTYLAAEFPASVEQVRVGKDSVVIEGGIPVGQTDTRLVEIPLDHDAYGEVDPAMATKLSADAAGKFRVELPRWTDDKRDRLLSRWAVAKPEGGKAIWISHARHADSAAALSTLPEELPKGRKGLGGYHLGSPQEDIADLGIGSVTVNLLLGHLLYLAPGEGRTPFSYGGRTWYADGRTVAGYDATLQAAARQGIIVSAILLLPKANQFGDKEVGKMMTHPDADPEGVYTMPNFTSADGVRAYAAAVEYLAQRYCRADKRYGRIHHWILHNEVNSGWFWTNAGNKSVERYTDLYLRSMRLVHLIARQYDPSTKAFISLEHHWTATYGSHGFQGRRMMELLAEFCRAEGDFEWALAYHPYPSNLFDPKSWNDRDARPSFDTPKITFKNLEVLDAWMRRPDMLYGGKPRVVHLTEQGPNAKDYSESAMREQAAGMAYAWNKLSPLSTIKVFHYHAWIDNRGEGGLRIGLRKFGNESGDPQGKKPVWDVYRALDTPAQDAATAFAKPLIGIKEWSEIKITGPIR